MENYWNILGIDENAEKTEIKKAYARMIRKHPPDKDPEGFKQIRAAYDALYNDTPKQAACDLTDIPEQWKTQYYEVIELQKKGRLDEAIHLCDKLLKKHPAEQFEVLLGRIYLDTDYSGKAVKMWEKITSTYPQNQDYLLELAKAYEKRGWFNKSVNICKKLKEQGMRTLSLFGLYASVLPDNTKSDDIIHIEKDAELLLADIEYPTEDDFLCFYEILIRLIIKLHSVPNSVCYYANQILPFLKIQAQRERKSTWLLRGGISFYCYLGENLDTKNIQESFCSYSDWIHANPLSLNSELQLVVMSTDKLWFIKQLEKDTQIPDLFKEDLHFFYEKNIINEVKRLSDIQGYDSDNMYLQSIVDDSEYEFSLEQEYGTFLFWLDHYQEFYPCLPYIKETYPILAKGMAPYLDLMMNSNKYQLRKEYEKKYRKLMGYPAGGVLTTREMVCITDGTESYRREEAKVGRNDPCPCGSGKKYKKCCGKNE